MGLGSPQYSFIETQILHSAAVQHFCKLSEGLGRVCAAHFKSVYLKMQACAL